MGCHSLNQLHAGSSIVVWAFPQSYFIIALQNDLMFINTTEPFPMQRIFNKILNKIPDALRLIKPFFLTTYLIGIIKSYHRLCLRPPKFFPDQYSFIRFVKEASLSIQS